MSTKADHSEGVEVRAARPEDAAAIAAFQVAMARETEDLQLDPDVVRRGVEAVFRQPRLGRYFVAERAGEVIASLLITYEWSDWRAAMVWWIQSVYVRPEERGKGVYRTMYRHVQRMVADDPAVSGIRLYVDKRNRRAREVYRRLGMDGDHYLLFEWMK